VSCGYGAGFCRCYRVYVILVAARVGYILFSMTPCHLTLSLCILSEVSTRPTRQGAADDPVNCILQTSLLTKVFFLIFKHKFTDDKTLLKQFSDRQLNEFISLTL